MNRLRIVQMLFCSGTHLMSARAVKGQIIFKSQRIKSLGMQLFHLLLNILQGKASHTADCIREILVNHGGINTDCFKVLGTFIGLDRGNTHLGSNLYDAM